ncbi:MAG: DUF2505 domain-containing protein, partial [Propionibacteriaceae bacterium]|nr:DUF2505 domain-containing protein [Propionibacteriaceae bacterium]
MHIDVQHHYDASPVAVHAMLADPAFWQSILTDEGRVESCQVDAIPGGVSMTLGVAAPSQLSRFTGGTLNLTLQTTWQVLDDGWSGPITIDVEKVPGSFAGTSTITPDGNGTSVVYNGDFTIHIPLVGKALEQKAAPYLTSVLAA